MSRQVLEQFLLTLTDTARSNTLCIIHSLTTRDQAGLSASDMVIMQSCFCRDLLVASFSQILPCWSPDWTETMCVHHNDDYLIPKKGLN